MAVTLIRGKYNNSQLLEINSKMMEAERERYEKENPFWTRAEKDASAIRRKYFEQMGEVLLARGRREEEQKSGNLFSL